MVIQNNSLKSVEEFNVLDSLTVSHFANLYRVEDVNTLQEYTLKAIKKPNNKYQINNEIALLKVIKNAPNVLRLYKVFRSNKKLFFVYESSKYKDLYSHVLTHGALNESAILKVLSNIVETLKYTHGLGVIHNDIQPKNIFIDDSSYCLSNWSYAKQATAIKTIFVPKEKLYLAPEIYEGNSIKESDIYALGATLYFLATGKEIFDFRVTDKASYLMYANCKLNIDLSDIKSDKIKYLILMMLHKDYQKRATLEQIEEVIDNKSFQLKINTKHDSHLEYRSKNDMELYEPLVEDEIAYALNNLALLYEIDSKDHDLAKAFELYEKASEKGLADAQYHLAQCYERFFENPKEAFNHYKKAAISNHPQAIYDLASYYEKGIYVEADMKKAIQLYFESANHGNLKAYKKLSQFQ